MHALPLLWREALGLALSAPRVQNRALLLRLFVCRCCHIAGLEGGLAFAFQDMERTFFDCREHAL